jgi:hypothetical protein
VPVPPLPPLRLLLVPVPVVPPLWLPPRLPPVPPELVDDPPPSLLELPDVPALDWEALDELLPPEPPPWLLLAEARVPPLDTPPDPPLLLWELEDPPDARREPVSSLQPQEHATRTVRAVIEIRMVAPYFTSSGRKPAGTWSVRYAYPKKCLKWPPMKITMPGSSMRTGPRA